VLVSRIYDWQSNQQVFEKIAIGKYVIVEGSAGLIQDRFLRYFDLTVWIDVAPDIAHARGKRRDRVEQHVDHDDLWDNVWGPLELQGFEDLRPDMKADVLLSNRSKP
jgi:uridine kinase